MDNSLCKQLNALKTWTRAIRVSDASSRASLRHGESTVSHFLAWQPVRGCCCVGPLPSAPSCLVSQNLRLGTWSKRWRAVRGLCAPVHHVGALDLDPAIPTSMDGQPSPGFRAASRGHSHRLHREEYLCDSPWVLHWQAQPADPCLITGTPERLRLVNWGLHDARKSS